MFRDKDPTYSHDDVIKLIEKKGFVFDGAAGSHQVYYNDTTKARLVVLIHYKPLPRGLIDAILKQAGIKTTELL